MTDVREQLKPVLNRLDEMVQLLDGELSTTAPASQPTLAAIVAWNADRQRLQARLAELESFVMEPLRNLSGQANEPLNALQAQAPEEIASVRERLDQVRTLVRGVEGRDRKRSAMLTRACALVRGYLEALSPSAGIYTAAGRRAPASVPATRGVRR